MDDGPSALAVALYRVPISYRVFVIIALFIVLLNVLYLIFVNRAVIHIYVHDVFRRNEKLKGTAKEKLLTKGARKTNKKQRLLSKKPSRIIALPTGTTIRHL